MKIYTNGTCLQNNPEFPRLFELIYKHQGFVWVKALNGNYSGEFLTFREMP